MKTPRQPTNFGKRKEPHTVIIARGEHIRHFTVRPWLAALGGSAIAAVAIGYVLATSYLVLRDDLIGATVARQARMQQAYEDRISALRAQVDRITSRQLLDQQLMEDKVSELLARQAELAERQGRMGPLLEPTAVPLADVPVPQKRPDIRAGLATDTRGALGFAPEVKPMSPVEKSFALLWKAESRGTQQLSSADRADKLFVAINQSLRTIETDQMTKLRSLTEDAYETAKAIAIALSDAGLVAAEQYGEDGVGGPLVAVDGAMKFDDVVEDLDDALARLDTLKSTARKLPIANPAPGKQVSSGYGVRRDPLLGTPALHAGMDFRAESGSAIRASGGGTVVAAGWNGGYGQMVEIDHGQGLRTRYAHLSAIAVNRGDIVPAGDIIGKVGSTGRSTGPHLHYEVRRNGQALNPLVFIKAGKAIAKLL